MNSKVRQRTKIFMLFLTVFILCCWSVPSRADGDFILTDRSRARRAILVRSSNPRSLCRFYRHGYPIRQVVDTNHQGVVTSVRDVSQAEWSRVMFECQRRASPASIPSVNGQPSAAAIIPTKTTIINAKEPVTSGNIRDEQLNQNVKQQLSIIYPGTKWCGPGAIADHQEDFGIRTSTDRCCRDHDFCPDTMSPGTCKYGICNETPYSKSHCDCDEKFRRCLMQSTDSAGLSVGFIYFDVAAVSCFRQNSTQCENGRRNEATGWCFETPQPFKKQALQLQQQQQLQVSRSTPAVAGSRQHGLLFKHVWTTAGDVTTAVTGAAIASLSKGGSG